jgi:hypothetical protein
MIILAVMSMGTMVKLLLPWLQNVLAMMSN